MFSITWVFSSDINENTQSKLKDTFMANDQLKRHLGCLCEIPDVHIYAKLIVPPYDPINTNVKANLSALCKKCGAQKNIITDFISRM